MTKAEKEVSLSGGKEKLKPNDEEKLIFVYRQANAESLLRFLDKHLALFLEIKHFILF